MELIRNFGKNAKGSKGIVLFLSFFAPFVIMVAIFAGNSIYPFGDRSFLVSDMYHQYMPFFQEFVQKVKAGEGLDYSWNIGIGSNFLALYGYYLASPLHWLAFLFPAAHLMEFMSWLVVFKIGFAGLCACIYLCSRKTAQGRAVPYFALLISCFYALSGYVAAYNYNIMWLDCIILAPIILLGLERLVTQGKIWLYTFSLGLCILTNFYISIMVCIFLVLYFLFLFFTEKNKLRMTWQFAVASLLAGGMAGALLVPEVFALLATDFGDMSFPEKWKAYFSVLDILARHCMGITTEKALEHWPNIYCGTIVFLTVPLYAVNDQIPMKKRFGMLGLAGIFLLSFGTNVPDFLWHGFNYPDSLPARQSFLYILLVLTMCHECLTHLDGIGKSDILKIYLGCVLFFWCVEKFVDSDDFHTWDWLMNLLFVTLYAICLYVYQTKEGWKVKYGLATIAFVAVLAECAINMSLTSVGTTNRASYLKHLEDYRALYARNAMQGEGLSRVEKFSRKTKNDAALVGFPSASVFSSTMNSQVMDLYTKLGMRHSKVYYCYDGATAFSSALLNVSYLYDESDTQENALYRLVDQENGVFLYEARYQLPFGYVAPEGFDLPTGLKYHGISVQNELVEQLGLEGVLLRKVKADDSSEDIEFTASKDGVYYGLVWDYGTAKINMTGQGEGEWKFQDLKKDCILYLGELKEGQKITLKNGDEEDKTPKISVAVYRLDLDLLEQALECLGRNHMTQVKVRNREISGHLSLEETGRLVLSVPYEKGWRVSVNGEEKEPVQFGGALMALDLGPGEYDIEMRYSPQGKVLGRFLSAGSLFLVTALLLADRRYRSRKKKKEAP